jgi:hypothetical protein
LVELWVTKLVKVERKRMKPKNPSLKTSMKVKIRREFADYDYRNKLSDKDRDWLDKFTAEYYGGSIDADNLDRHLHNTPELKKDCYDRNNHQNNDTFGIARVNGLLTDNLKEAGETLKTKPDLTEEALIAYVDEVNFPEDE